MKTGKQTQEQKNPEVISGTLSLSICKSKTTKYEEVQNFITSYLMMFFQERTMQALQYVSGVFAGFEDLGLIDLDSFNELTEFMYSHIDKSE